MDTTSYEYIVLPTPSISTAGFKPTPQFYELFLETVVNIIKQRLIESGWEILTPESPDELVRAKAGVAILSPESSYEVVSAKDERLIHQIVIRGQIKAGEKGEVQNLIVNAADIIFLRPLMADYICL